MKKTTAILLHLLFWIYKFGWGTIVQQIYKPENIHFRDFFTLYQNSNYIYSLTTFYINYCIIMPLFFKKKKNVQLVLSWLLLFAFFICLRYFIEEYLYLKWFGVHNYSDGTTSLYYVLDNLYFGGALIIPSIVIYIIVHWMKVESEQVKLKEAAATAEVNFLKSQVNPHFVFNTLNNIYSLVYHQSAKALPAILRLSELMRYMARESAVEKVPVEKEIKYIEGFIELESLRVTGEVYVQMKVKGDATGLMIAPLLMIPFVENGFKHGVLTETDSPFVIDISVAYKTLTLHTNNKISQHQKDSGNGIGLQNVERRLQLTYPGNYKLEAGKQGDNYICNLTINL